MKDEIKEKFCSLEELKRTIDCYDGYSDNEEVYYFVGALRFAYNYITNLEKENERLNKDNLLLIDYQDMEQKYDDYKSRNEKAKSLTNRTIEIIKQQPSGNDEWILERLNGINYCLGGDEE